jgi:heme/copper-type cytochrome/quinol oxidase subunit 3
MSRRENKTWSEFVGSMIATILFDLLAALFLMWGLHGLHVKAGYWPCFIICCAAYLVVINGRSES